MIIISAGKSEEMELSHNIDGSVYVERPIWQYYHI